MSNIASMINLDVFERIIFAIPVPGWSKQHEVVLNPSSSWIKYPSPKGWDWLKLQLDENYRIIGLSTPTGFKSYDGTHLNQGSEILDTMLRSHIVANAPKYGVAYSDEEQYLIVEMFFR